jgi:hypothetical protein
MDLRGIGWDGMDWIDLAQDVFVNMEMKLRGPQNVREFLSSCTTGGFSRRAQLHGVNHTFEVLTVEFSPVHSNPVQ